MRIKPNHLVISSLCLPLLTFKERDENKQNNHIAPNQSEGKSRLLANALGCWVPFSTVGQINPPMEKNNSCPFLGTPLRDEPALCFPSNFLFLSFPPSDLALEWVASPIRTPRRLASDEIVHFL